MTCNTEVPEHGFSVGHRTAPLFDEEEIKELKRLYLDVTKHTFDTVETGVSCVLHKLEGLLEALKEKMSVKSRTAKLWVQYLKYIALDKLFLQAERTCDWSLHLYIVSKMLNLIAASGHSNYTRSCRVYLQQMMELPHTNEGLHGRLSSGQHTIRPTDVY
jgi:hypothetical protein